MSARFPRCLIGSARIFALLLGAGLAGCASKSYVVLLPSPDGSVGKVIVTGQQGEQTLTTAGHALKLDGSPGSTAVADSKIKQDFGEARAALPMMPVRYLLYFTSDTNLTRASEALIPKIIAEAKSRPAVDVSVIGHTDTMSTTAYNDQLALDRATRVAQLLREKGLKANSLVIESHGKRNLLIPTADNTYEARNRRVEVSVR